MRTGTCGWRARSGGASGRAPSRSTSSFSRPAICRHSTVGPGADLRSLGRVSVDPRELALDQRALALAEACPDPRHEYLQPSARGSAEVVEVHAEIGEERRTPGQLDAAERAHRF